MKPNNFFVLCSFPLQFTHINLQHVTFLYLKGFFLTQKRKKLWQINQKMHFPEFANLRVIWLKSGEF